MNERTKMRLIDALSTIMAFFVRAWFVKLLWNGLATHLFSVHVITYWQSAGLLYLVNCFIYDSHASKILDRLERLVWKGGTQ